MARFAARPYLVGPDLLDALDACRRLGRRDLGCTVCYWNSDTETPRQVADAYAAALTGLVALGLDGYLSMKAPALGFSSALLAELLEKARPAQLRLHFDSLTPDAAERTFELIRQAVDGYPRIGCTLPARWKRSSQDAERAVELGVFVRVVKGQWADPEADQEARSAFLSLIDRLSGRARHVGVATHDVSLGREALRRLVAEGTRCELELLYGLPRESAMRSARRLGVPVRLYVPYGHGWLPYALSQVRRNPRILWWLLRDLVRSGSASYRR